MFKASWNAPMLRRAVAEEADRDLAGLAVLGRPRGPERDREMRPDDRVGAHHPVLDAGQVHRAALATEQAGPAAEELGEDRRHGDPAGERVVVAAIRAERVVVAAHRRPEAGRHRFLAVAEVGRPADEPFKEELLGSDFEVPALDHRPVHPEPGRAVDLGEGRRHRCGS